MPPRWCSAIAAGRAVSPRIGAFLARPLYIKGTPFTITGIAPRGFEGADLEKPTDFWIPLQTLPNLKCVGHAGKRADSIWLTELALSTPSGALAIGN